MLGCCGIFPLTGGGVDDGCHLHKVVDEDAVEERLVAVLHSTARTAQHSIAGWVQRIGPGGRNVPG